MKILMINGSPRANGNTALAFSEMEKIFHKNGIETEIVRVGSKDIRGCTSCRYCFEHHKCVFDDIVNELAVKFEECDGMIIGSPVYHAGVNGTLVSLLNRLFYSTHFDKTMKVGAAVVALRRGGGASAFDQLNKFFTVYGMPVVVDNNGTKQMYFTISSTNGYVSTSTAARSVTLTYEFTDPNGKTLTFTKNWNFQYADYKDVAQYSYSDFVKGTMTDLLASSSGGSSSCLTPDTLITLANGTQIRVDSLTGNEELLVWNMETGMLDKAPIMFLDSDPETVYDVIKLYFSDGTEVKVIAEHGFWDYDLNRYVYLDANAADYIGHTFAKQNGDNLEKVTLVDVVIESETTTAWSPVTVGHLCYFVNGMLSMPGGVGGLFNIFEVDPETMTYDYEQLEKDIETYGLYTYEELNAICPLSEDMFNAAGGAYLKISIGKGNLTEEELIGMITRYSKFFE